MKNKKQEERIDKCLNVLLNSSCTIDEKAHSLEELLESTLLSGAEREAIQGYVLLDIRVATMKSRGIETVRALEKTLIEIGEYKKDKLRKELENKKKLLRSIAPGQEIVVNHGHRNITVDFLEVKRTRFYVKEQNGDNLNLPITSFQKIHK